MPELPTCWYCPECGQCCRDRREIDILDDNLQMIYHDDHGRPCPGDLVEATVVPHSPSGDERHAILRLLGFDVHEGWVHRRRLSISYDRPADRYLDEYTRVFVPRDQRETTETKEGAHDA